MKVIKEGASIYDGYEEKRKKTEVKGAKGWFVHPNPGDPEAMKRFNHSVKDDASVPTGETTSGETSTSSGDSGAAVSGGMGEALEETVDCGIIAKMPIKKQRKIRQLVLQSLKDGGYRGKELDDRLHDAMTGRLCDLEDAIDLSKLDESLDEDVEVITECALDTKVRKICEGYTNAKVGATPTTVKHYYDRGQSTFIINVLDESNALIKTCYTSSIKDRNDCLTKLKEKYNIKNISRYTLDD